MATLGTAVPGTVVPSGSLANPGGAQGVQGLQGPTGPIAPSANAGNLITQGTDSLLYLPPSAIQPTIWSARLRSFNSLNNPNFEINQRLPGSNTVSATGTVWPLDRWGLSLNGMSAGLATGQQIQTGVVVPGTNFYITQNYLSIVLNTQQSSLAASDILWINHIVEGPMLREMINDVHSFSILARSSVANLVFGIALRDYSSGNGTRSLTKACSLGAANTWTMIQLPNLPVWASGGAWAFNPGIAGYQFSITLACGATFTAPANDTWQTGNFVGAVGQSNFAASPVNSNFQIAFVQHEPGAVCTTLIDKPFPQNYDECLRYFCKSYDYGNLPGIASNANEVFMYCNNTNALALGYVPFPKQMAKNPIALNIWNSSTGTANQVQEYPSTTNRVYTGASWNSRCISYMQATSLASGQMVRFHYTADTGW